METSSSQHRRQKKERDSSNLVTLCKILKTVHILDHCKGHGDSLDLYCHGSLRYQASTTVVDGAGTDTGASKLGLICRQGRFVAAADEVRPKKCCHLTVITLTETDSGGGHYMLEEAGTQTCQDPGALLWSGIGWKDIRFREESICGNSHSYSLLRLVRVGQSFHWVADGGQLH